MSTSVTLPKPIQEILSRWSWATSHPVLSAIADDLERVIEEYRALLAAFKDSQSERGETLFRFDYEYERGRIMGEALYTHKQAMSILGRDTITGRPWSPDLLRIHLVAVTEQDVRTFEREQVSSGGAEG